MDGIHQNSRPLLDTGNPATCRGKKAPRAAWSLRLRGVIILLSIILSICGCTGKEERIGIATPPQERKFLIAVFPVENLSGKVAPLGEIGTLFKEGLKGYGFGILDDEVLNTVITRHRVRYTAGVEKGIGKAFKDETGADAILIPSVELYDDVDPPKVALFCRLVSTGDDPAILWIDGTGIAGDDSPGILGLGLVEEPRVLLAKAVESLTRSLAQYGSEGGDSPKGERGARKFRPKIVYRSDGVDPEKKYSIAVVPFFNKSDRKYAGEIIALHMIRNLMAPGHFEIVEPGIVRQELLRFRIIMSEGVSLPDTETILNAVNADLVLNGEVLEYQDYPGPEGNAKVDFSVLFIERKTRKVVYSSYSQNTGDDGVLFFDWGKVNTAHAMASQMARAIGQRMLMEADRSQTSRISTEQKSTTQP